MQFHVNISSGCGHFCETVSLFWDSVDRALDICKL